jgi:GT2 family glycosyltransferase
MNDAPSACVGVVLVNWNGWTYTAAAARSLDQSDYRNLKIIIVDNASSDDSLVQLRAAIPHADIIAHPVNAGFSGGCNIGIRRAIEQGCEYVFLLNNDALAENSTIAKLVEASKVKNDMALLGSSIVYVSSGEYQFFGSQTAAVLGGSDRYDVRFQSHLLTQDFIETDVVLGAALFLPAKVLARTGLFDERFFLNYEETDLCYRAQKLGLECFVVPSSQIRHHANAAIGPVGAPMQSYFLTRNVLLFADKHASLRRRLRVYQFHVTALYRNIRKSWQVGNFMDLPTRAMARGFLDYALRHFGDCPAVIRQYDACYRRQAYVPSSASR